MKNKHIITGQECINDYERLTEDGRSRRRSLNHWVLLVFCLQLPVHLLLHLTYLQMTKPRR